MKTILLIFICAATAINCFGQVRYVSKEEYDAAQDSAFSKTNTILRRVTTETNSYKANKIVSIEKLTIESFPNGDARWNSVTTSDGHVTKTFQLIYLGKYEYRKEGDADWTKTCVKDCSKSEMGPTYGMTGKELPKVEEYVVADSTIGGESTSMYYFYRVYQMGKSLNFYQRKIWIDSDSRIRKEESITSDVYPTNITSMQTVTYEYNPKDIAAIEAPIK